MKHYSILAGVMACFFSICTLQAQKSIPHSPARKLQMAEFAISRLYVDKVDEEKLVEAAIIAMLKDLDPHSVYSDAEEVKRLNEPLQGNFDGIGVQFNMSKDTLVIIQPVSGGPSEKVGILAGDRIIQVNDTLIAGVKITTDEIMRRLRGPKGSEVQLKIMRRGIDELLNFTVKRDKIPVYSLDASYMATPTIGYIKINRFGATTHNEFMKALSRLKQQGMKHLVLDLQGNGGGYLKAAIDIANEFLSSKELIVYTEGKKSTRSEFVAKGNGRFQQGRLAVLVDEYAASASEIVSGAIQDWDRGVLVGRRTFGKGLVQRPIDLPDGSMIRLTVARYYTPSGRCIQKPYESKENYDHELIDRYNRGEMIHADSIHFPDSMKFATCKLARTVYGGGGIMPDYFVPVDTTRYTRYHTELTYKGVLLQTDFQLLDQYRSTWQKQYKTFQEFYEKFELTDAMLQLLIKNGEAMKIKYNEAQFQQSRELIKLQLKALLARDLWDMNEYFYIINKVNDSLNKAIQLLEQSDFNALLQKK